MDATSRAQDEWLALRCQAGEPEAFEDLVRIMERPLLYYAAKLLSSEERAVDVLQDVWIRVFRKIGTLKNPATLRSWLYHITHGISIDRIRRDVSRTHAEETHWAQAEETTEAGFDSLDAPAVHQALDQIDVRHRDVLVLHFLEDFSLAEIAAVIGCPEGTVKSRIHYAKKALKEELLRGGYGSKP